MMNKDEIIISLDRISNFVEMEYCDTGKTSFKYIHSCIEQLKVLINHPTTDIKELNICQLDICSRTLNCLQAKKINLIKLLIEKTSDELLNIPGLGEKSLEEIKSALSSKDLKLKGD
jgi:DNA-directed RNA polymerase alpha subunit